MNSLPAPIETIQVQERANHSERLAVLHEALRRLRWDKTEDGELHADRITREIRRLEARDG